MQEDDKGNLWLCTENGISKFLPSIGSFENFDARSLNLRMRFNEAASLKKQNGLFLFGTSDGILFFHPDSIRKTNYVPSLVFTRLQLKNEYVMPHENAVITHVLDDVDKLTLSHKENIFSLQYAALDMVAPEQMLYADRLDGFDKDWSYVDAQRAANYTNLPKGNYVFKVKSTNSDGVWTDNVRMLPITVLPSFWETPWAYFLYVVAILLTVFLAVYILFTIFRLKHKVTIEQQISDIKLRFFTNISHELRTPLTLISGPVEHVLQRETLTSSEREQLNVVQRNADRMLHLVNQILDFRKIQNKRMKLRISLVEVVSFTRRVMENFESFAAERANHFLFETESTSVHLSVAVDTLYQIYFYLIYTSDDIDASTTNNVCLSWY